MRGSGKHVKAEYGRLVLRFRSFTETFENSLDRNERATQLRQAREIIAEARALLGYENKSREQAETRSDHHGLFVVSGGKA